jgi:RsiG-like
MGVDDQHPRRRRLDEVTDPAFIAGLEDMSNEELREKRAILDELDTELSYYRRMLHGRMDLLEFELRRRTGEETRTLIEALPQILAAGVGGMHRSPIPKELPLEPPDSGSDERHPVDTILQDDFLAHLPTIEDDELMAIQATLTDAERIVSRERRAVYDVFDVITAELTRRYKEGLADAGDLLSES